MDLAGVLVAETDDVSDFCRQIEGLRKGRACECLYVKFLLVEALVLQGAVLGDLQELDSLFDLLDVLLVECVLCNFCGFCDGACDVLASVDDPCEFGAESAEVFEGCGFVDGTDFVNVVDMGDDEAEFRGVDVNY